MIEGRGCSIGSSLPAVTLFCAGRVRLNGFLMNVTYHCPSCDQGARVTAEPGVASIVCPHCGHSLIAPEGAWEGPRLTRCLCCPSRDLFVRKDFPQRLGVGIVVIGFVASAIAWNYYHIYTTFAILFATALLDVVLYLLFGNALTCYRCGATYRRLEGLDSHRPFDLEIHERYRQQAARTP